MLVRSAFQLQAYGNRAAFEKFYSYTPHLKEANRADLLAGAKKHLYISLGRHLNRAPTGVALRP